MPHQAAAVFRAADVATGVAVVNLEAAEGTAHQAAAAISAVYVAAGVAVVDRAITEVPNQSAGDPTVISVNVCAGRAVADFGVFVGYSHKPP